MDVSKIEPGDTITVRGVVKSRCGDGDLVVGFPYTDFDGEMVAAEDDPAGEYVHPSAIVSHEPKPRPLQVGDIVTWGGRAVNYKIRSIVDGMAMLEPVTFGYIEWLARNLSDLVRVNA